MRVLVVDDDPGLRKSLALLLEQEGYAVVTEGEPARALERLGREPFEMILCDVRMPQMDGLTFLRKYRETGGSALVIMMSAFGGEDAALAAMKEGAYDYLPKPFRTDEVVLVLRKAEERERLRDRVATLEAEVASLKDRDLVAESPSMRKVLELATRVAPHATTVLITGESGTGKEVIARAIHRMSPRRDAAFVAVNCGAIPENLLESELFGHVRGAFTGATQHKRGLFEEATGGTLLLDEIGDLPASLQVKLLRVLQEGEVRRVGGAQVSKIDVRVLAATARDLSSDVKAGRFREDLYYRLNVVHLHLPPLRERPEDLERLTAVLLERAAKRAGRRVALSAGAVSAIRSHAWPGNVRELENAIERAVVLSERLVLDASDLRPPPGHPSLSAVTDAASANGTLRESVARAEREAITHALAATGGNRRAAAERLGVSLRTLFYKMERLGIE